jgi:hypothetical protein
MVSKIFGGLSFRGDQGLLCRKMASAAQRWPFVNLRTDVFCESWFGETHPGHSEPRWHVNEKQELIYGERDQYAILQEGRSMKIHLKSLVP